MPGNELSKFPSQRKPYVVHKTPSGLLDKKGNYVQKKSELSHISIDEYDFKIFEKVLKNAEQ